jgi:hypothetical protein
MVKVIMAFLTGAEDNHQDTLGAPAEHRITFFHVLKIFFYGLMTTIIRKNSWSVIQPQDTHRN